MSGGLPDHALTLELERGRHTPLLTFRGFAESVALMGVSSAANAVRGVLSAKILAVLLGPSPVGVLSQLITFSALLMTVVPLGLTTGVAKMVAASKHSEEASNRVIGSALAIGLGSGLLAAVVALFLAGPLSNLLLGTSKYAVLVALLAASLPLSNFSGVVNYILQGLAELRLLTAVNILAAAAALVTIAPLAYLYGLEGAVVAVVASSVFQAAISAGALVIAYSRLRWDVRRMRIGKSEGSQLLGYGGIMLVAGAVLVGGTVIVRTLLTRKAGTYANGLYQVPFVLSAQYISVFLLWMSAYVFPRIASERSPRRVAVGLNFALVANLLVLTPIFVGVVAARGIVINVLLSSAFLAAAPLVIVQVLGDLLRVVGWSYGYALFAQGHPRAHLLLVATQTITWIVLAAPLIPFFGAAGVVGAYAVSQLTTPLLAYGMGKRWFGLRITTEAVGLLAMAAFLIVAAALLPAWIAPLLIPVFPLVFFLARRRPGVSWLA